MLSFCHKSKRPDGCIEERRVPVSPYFNLSGCLLIISSSLTVCTTFLGGMSSGHPDADDDKRAKRSCVARPYPHLHLR